MNKYCAILALALAGADVDAQITGRVWRDNNINGIAEAEEKWQSGITVKAFGASGNLAGITTTDASGNYVLDVPDKKNVRLEFAGLPTGMVPAPGQSLLRFVRSPAQESLAIYQPATYTGDAPRVIQSVYAMGSMKTNGIDSIASLVSFPAINQRSSTYSTITPFTQTGSIWGVAYDRDRKRIFSSAIAKRHSSLGSLGTGGIYVTSLQGDTHPFLNLDALGFPTSSGVVDRSLSHEWGKPDHDSLMFAQVAKVGLGGLDISDDSRFLYTVNLYDRKLYRIELPKDGTRPSASDIVRASLPSEALKGGNARPFAVKYYQGNVYVGVVCDAQISEKKEDLIAVVYSIDADALGAGKAKFKELTRFSLDYARGSKEYDMKGWYPWTDNYLTTLAASQSGWMIYPQPIVADIEFDTDGSMIVSLMDRLGHQTGDGQLYRPNAKHSLKTTRGLSGGDVLRFSKTRKNFETEQNGRSGSRLSSGRFNGEGPGGGEFYAQDAFIQDGVALHNETASGGLSLLPDQNSIVVSVREPDQFVTGGVKWFNNETGEVTGAMSVFPGGMKPGYFWKSNNVGDVELITPLPPTEIGDRVWLDNNGNGIQDPEEPGIANLELSLYRDGLLIGSTKSDRHGKYVFNEKNLFELIEARTEYEIRIALEQSGIQYILTEAYKSGSSEIDSDALKAGGYALMKFTTTNPGENIHNLDAGFLCNDKPDVVAETYCKDNKVYVNLLGAKDGELFNVQSIGDLSQEDESLKEIISGNPQVAADLEREAPFESTIRIYAPSGCYQDIFITTADQKGCTYIAGSVSLPEAYAITAFPNPSTGPLQISYRGKNADNVIRIQITDQKGNVLQDKTEKLQDGYYHYRFDLSGLASGSYLVSVVEGNQITTKTIARP
jgi:hypothetical protein